MDDFERQLGELHQTLVDLDGDGVPDVPANALAGARPVMHDAPPQVMPSVDTSPMPRGYMQDPMTLAQIEGSRRTIADARARPAVNAAMTLAGVPLMHKAYNDVREGYNRGSMVQMGQGVAEGALAAMPFTRVGRAVMGAHPFTTFGSYAAVPSAQFGASANAAPVGTPPLPVSREAAMAPKPQPVPEQPPAAQPSANWIDLKQIGNAIYEGGRGAVNYLGALANELTSTPEYQPPNFEQWAEQTGVSVKLEAARRAEELSGRNIPGVGSRSADDMRNKARAQSERLQNEALQEYRAFVEAGRQKFESDRANKRFAEQYPQLNATLKTAPQTAAGLMYMLANRRHGKDVMRRVNKDVPNQSGADLARTQDNIAEGISSRVPVNPLPYFAGGVGTSTATGVVLPDIIDYASAPPGSERAKSLAAEYSTREGLQNKFADLGVRVGAGGGLLMAGYGAGRVMSPLNRQSNYQAARDAAGLPNTNAAAIRARSEREMMQLERDRNADLSDHAFFSKLQRDNDFVDATRAELFKRAQLDEYGLSPSKARKLLSQKDQKSPPNTGDQDAPYPPGSPAGPKPQAPASGPQTTSGAPGGGGQPNTPGGQSGPRGQGQGSQAQKASSVFPKSKRNELLKRVAEKDGKITANDIKSIQPNLTDSKAKELAESIPRIYKQVGKENFKKIMPDLLKLGVVGTVATGVTLPDE